MDDNKTKQTVEERRIKRIAQLRAILQKEEGLLNHNKRKKRTGELIAFGVMMEQVYESDPAQRELLEKWACEYLNGRNLERVQAGFKRLLNVA